MCKDPVKFAEPAFRPKSCDGFGFIVEFSQAITYI